MRLSFLYTQVLHLKYPLELVGQLSNGALAHHMQGSVPSTWVGVKQSQQFFPHHRHYASFQNGDCIKRILALDI